MPFTTDGVVFFGLNGESFDFRGIFVNNVKFGGPADNAGINIGDIITEVNGIECGINFGQTSHTTGYWKVKQGETVSVKVLTAISNYKNEVTKMVNLSTLPPADEDYPLSGIS
jgi:S1-C subfamily serine protease